MKRTLLLLFAIVLGFEMAQAAKHVITQVNNTFTPDLISVNVGDTIRWEWTGGTHTITNKNIPSGASSWDSPLTAANPSFEYVVTLPGEYEYMCTIHESMGMKGKFEAGSSSGAAEYAVDLVPILSCCGNSSSMHLFSQSELPYAGVMSIYDRSGKKVYEMAAAFAGGSSELCVTDANLSQGIYILQLLTQQRKKLSIKFLVP